MGLLPFQVSWSSREQLQVYHDERQWWLGVASDMIPWNLQKAGGSEILMDLRGEKVERTIREGGKAAPPPEWPSAAHRDGINPLKTPLWFMGALVSAAPLKPPPSSHTSDGFWSNEMPGYIAGLSSDSPKCEDIGTDNLISCLISLSRLFFHYFSYFPGPMTGCFFSSRGRGEKCFEGGNSSEHLTDCDLFWFCPRSKDHPHPEARWGL